MAAVFFLLRKPRAAVAGLLGLFFAVSLTLDGLWYLRPSYTLRDASRSLASAAADGTMFVGYWSHELSLENRALPIRTPWSQEVPMNAWFADEASRRSFLMIVNEDFDGEPGRGRDAQKLQVFLRGESPQSAGSTFVQTTRVDTGSGPLFIALRLTVTLPAGKVRFPLRCAGHVLSPRSFRRGPGT